MLNIFANCEQLKEVTCEIETPISGTFFTQVPLDLATLYVPDASLESYRGTSPWSGFGTIEPISPSGIDDINASKEATIDAIYDLDGKISSTTSRGIKIVRMSDGTTKKVLR